MGRRGRLAAGADWAFVRDASALAILREVETPTAAQPLPLLRCVWLRELRNDSGPRDPLEVIATFADDLKEAGMDQVSSDAHYREIVWRKLADENIGLIPAPVTQDGIAQTHLVTRALLHAGRLQLPRHARLGRQLSEVRAKATAGGGYVVELPRTDGSHGDAVAALVLAVWQLTRGARDYEHLAIPSRSVGFDPRHPADAAPDEIVPGVMRGEFSEYPPED